MIKVLIVEDHPIVVDGITQLLGNYPDIAVVGAAMRGSDFKEFLKTGTPNVVLMDINLPDTNGIELCRYVRENYPFVGVIALTGFNESIYVQKMIAEGAKGYLLKTALPEQIIYAVRTVYAGESYFCKEVSRDLSHNSEKLYLTSRETELLKLIVEGYTNREIADKLFLGVETINSYRKNLLLKLGVKNTASLVRFAITEKLI